MWIEVPTLDRVHSELIELARKSLPDGRPAYLFRGERGDYPRTFSSIDRYFHDPDCDEGVHDELDDVTAFAMKQPMPSMRLPPKLAGAFAQHYGLPTQVIDFTASPEVAIYFASHKRWHEDRSPVGNLGILDVRQAERDGICAVFDLRQFPQGLRARRQHAFGVIYAAFRIDDLTDLKQADIAEQIGLRWTKFGHLPDDEMYLHLIGANEDLTSTDNDVFAGLAQWMVDEFVAIHGPLSPAAAAILANEVPAIGRNKERNIALWTA
jgi:hypothetical protein